jgi:hypothetical protein
VLSFEMTLKVGYHREKPEHPCPARVLLVMPYDWKSALLPFPGPYNLHKFWLFDKLRRLWVF